LNNQPQRIFAQNFFLSLKRHLTVQIFYLYLKAPYLFGDHSFITTISAFLVVKHRQKMSTESLNEAQQKALDQMREKFTGAEGFGMEMNDHTLLRYLRAR
jgi:hypothetical protein